MHFFRGHTSEKFWDKSDFFKRTYNSYLQEVYIYKVYIKVYIYKAYNSYLKKSVYVRKFLKILLKSIK